MIHLNLTPTLTSSGCWFFSTWCISGWFDHLHWECNIRYLQAQNIKKTFILGVRTRDILDSILHERKQADKRPIGRLTNIRSDYWVFGYVDQQLPVGMFLLTSSQTVHTLQEGAIVSILSVGEPAGQQETTWQRT